jgi:hypothetical protein
VRVDDTLKAAEYYQRFFGFERAGGDTPAGLALLRGHGVSLLLRQASTAPSRPAGRDGPVVPDAVLLVRQPERMRWQLDDLGAHLLPDGELGPPWRRFFGFRDCYGNVLAAGPATGAADRAWRWAGQPAAAAGFWLQEQRRARLEARYRAGFRRFYDSLADRRDIYYLLVTTGLLHWAVKTASYVPRDVNLVLLGTDLQPDELAWARSQAGRPFHHIGLRLDDAGAWEFLFDVNRRNFGWISPGCHVLDEQIFAELARVGPGTSVNCAWSWPGDQGLPIASTHLVFINAEAVRAVRRAGVRASPGMYSHRRLNRQVEGRRCYACRPSPAEIRLLRRGQPASDLGRPAPPGGFPYFDTLVMYQLLARQRGFTVSRTRGLESLGHVRGRDVEDEACDELFYIGALGHADPLEELSGYFHDHQVRLLYLVAEYVTLAGAAAALPERYRRRLDLVTAELGSHGLAGPAVTAAARSHLTDVAGLSAGAAQAVLHR